MLVWSGGNAENIVLLASELASANATIAKDRISLSALKYVIRDDYRGCATGISKSAHLSPDLLSKANSFPIGPRETRPVWLSVDIPNGIPAGTYRGSISRQSPSGTVNHTINLEVQNMTLPAPSEWAFHLDIWQHPDAVARYGKVPLWSPAHLNLLRPMLAMLAQAGQKCITTTIVEEPWNHQTYDDFGSMIKWTKRADGTWSYDYSIFDTYVALAMECGIKEQINCYSMAPVGNAFTWVDELSGKTVKKVYQPGSTEYNDLWRPFLAGFRAHLQQKGWLGITAIAGDERGLGEMEGMLNLLQTTAPELKVALAGDHLKELDASIYDFSSYWGSVDYMSKGGAQTRRQLGHKTTFYTSCNISSPNTLLCSPPAEACYECWFASAMGFDGFLRWAYNSWPENPNVDARYTRWSAGDCWIVYPEARSSVRFERLREGIQDYEKIRILRRDLAGSKTPGAAAALKELNDFLKTINLNTPSAQVAAKVVNQGKEILFNATRVALGLRPGSASKAVSKPCTTPDEPQGCWKKPGPAAGPFQARLGDGSVVTY